MPKPAVFRSRPGASPLLGLGEGGPQFDRRGSTDRMVSGQGGYRLRTHGGRVPIPWLIGTAGWAMFIHQPFGTFDFSGPQSKFHPPTPDAELPLDIFFVASQRSGRRSWRNTRGLTGHAEMPPLWSFGYQQSHRTLASREEILAEAKTFREKKLPCDALIYLGTGFCPSGWNTENGSFGWNSRVFPDPEDDDSTQLHAGSFPRRAACRDSAPTACAARCATRATLTQLRRRRSRAATGTRTARISRMGVDGWWPDEGDPLDIPSRLVRNRMYWEGPQIDRPNERPYALHRNGYAGMQRYASFLWSGDVYSTWETLKTQIPIAINTALTGIPYWGTDIGGFVPTKEFTAELYVRWFQFGAFCPLFRSHGRTWKLRLPWGWNTGDPGPSRDQQLQRRGDSGCQPAAQSAGRAHLPQVSRAALPNAAVPVQRGARMHDTGMPVMRALWLHYPDDPVAVARGDQYLWGRECAGGAGGREGRDFARQVYLPRGDWYDFWTGERMRAAAKSAAPSISKPCRCMSRRERFCRSVR